MSVRASWNDRFAVFGFHDQSIHRADRARLHQSVLVDVRRLVMEVDEVGVVDLENFRGQVRAIARPDAEGTVNGYRDATDGSLAHFVAHIVVD